jgi:S-adenosylmethionine:tRNA ribosyltransferase-isomerase
VLLEQRLIFLYDVAMKTDELDYQLPQSAIATRPAEPRDHSRLMVYHRAEDRIEHRHFYDLPEYLRAGDLMIVNDTRVIPAKLELKKATGGNIPGLFVRELEIGKWEVMLRSRGKVKVGDVLTPADGRDEASLAIEKRAGEKGMWVVNLNPAKSAGEILARIGHVPLPPYIEKMRDPDSGDQESFDKVRYQTVYANKGASLAAPTAGLHFTPELLSKIESRGVNRAAVDLEVGLGTFLPIEADELEKHPMHHEVFSVPAMTAEAIRRQRASKNRIVVVGTTAVRTLESAAGAILDGVGKTSGSTNLFIKPGYQFRLTDALITNFHLPRSTLIALVGAFAGLGKIKDLYAVAVREGYRFYSYGDAMLLL